MKLKSNCALLNKTEKARWGSCTKITLSKISFGYLTRTWILCKSWRGEIIFYKYILTVVPTYQANHSGVFGSGCSLVVGFGPSAWCAGSASSGFYKEYEIWSKWLFPRHPKGCVSRKRVVPRGLALHPLLTMLRYPLVGGFSFLDFLKWVCLPTCHHQEAKSSYSIQAGAILIVSVLPDVEGIDALDRMPVQNTSPLSKSFWKGFSKWYFLNEVVACGL